MADQLNSAPQRACRLLLSIDADNIEDLADALRNFWVRLDRGELGGSGVSGGPSGGHIYELRQGDTPTRDEYFQQIEAYLAGIEKDAAAGVAPIAEINDGGDVQSLIDGLQAISKRCPTDSGDYTKASIGDTARMALAKWVASLPSEHGSGVGLLDGEPK